MTATWTEMMETMNNAAEQDARGERPDIVPANAVKEHGVWNWVDGDLWCWWMPGSPCINCWAKDIYVSRVDLQRR